MTSPFSRSAVLSLVFALSLFDSAAAQQAAATPTEIGVDWATFNPVSVVLDEQNILEQEFAKDEIAVRGAQSAGSSKALGFLNAGLRDFGSTAGGAALIGRINGNPVKAIDVSSRRERTALVARKDSPLSSIAYLKGKTVAARLRKYADLAVEPFNLSGYPHLKEAYHVAQPVPPQPDSAHGRKSANLSENVGPFGETVASDWRAWTKSAAQS